MPRPQFAASGYGYPLLIKQLLVAALTTSPQQEIISGTGHRYTYRAFRHRLGQLAHGLAALGVKPGDTVAIMNWDCHRYLECFFTVPMMGAVLHTINVRLSPEQILYTINHAEDDFIIVHADFVPVIQQLAARIERPAKLVYLRDDDTPTPARFVCEFEQLFNNGDAAFEFPDFDENTIATTFYTTGTTGDPKGVFYSHRQLVLHTQGLISALAPVADPVRLHRRDVYMPLTPLFHVHGWGMPYAATMLGLKQVYPGRYAPPKLLGLIETEGVTFSHCVPTILHMLLSAPEAEHTDLSGLKMIIGGAALPPGLARMAVARGIQVFTAYGMSETGPVATVCNTMAIDHTDTSLETLALRCKTGQPCPLVEVRVVDDAMQDIPRGGDTTGEVVLRAPWLTQGYTGNAETSEALWRGGYLHTGDVGYIDETGALRITDRLKDVIKSGGEWISSLQLESLASSCPGVSEVAAIGIPDPKWGERPALIIATTNTAPTESEQDAISTRVRAAITAAIEAGKLPAWALPETLIYVDTIAKTSVGKLDKKALRLDFRTTYQHK